MEVMASLRSEWRLSRGLGYAQGKGWAGCDGTPLGSVVDGRTAPAEQDGESPFVTGDLFRQEFGAQTVAIAARPVDLDRHRDPPIGS
jgi:hypothetical protein